MCPQNVGPTVYRTVCTVASRFNLRASETSYLCTRHPLGETVGVLILLEPEKQFGPVRGGTPRRQGQKNRIALRACSP